MCPLSRCAYILDVASEMEQVDGGYMLWFRRVLWDQPLKFENELYVTMHYNQVSACGPLCCSGTFQAPPCEVRLHSLGIWCLHVSSPISSPDAQAPLHGLCGAV